MALIKKVRVVETGSMMLERIADNYLKYADWYEKNE